MSKVTNPMANNQVTTTPVLTVPLIKLWYEELVAAVLATSSELNTRVTQELTRFELYVHPTSHSMVVGIIKRNYPLGFVVDTRFEEMGGAYTISLMRRNERLCLVSENGSVPTFCRVLFRYLRLLFDLANLPFKDVKKRLENNRYRR